MNDDRVSMWVSIIMIIVMIALFLRVEFMDSRLDYLEGKAHQTEAVKLCEAAYRGAFRRDPKLDSALVQIVIEGTPQCREANWFPGKID